MLLEHDSACICWTNYCNKLLKNPTQCFIFNYLPFTFYLTWKKDKQNALFLFSIYFSCFMTTVNTITAIHKD